MAKPIELKTGTRFGRLVITGEREKRKWGIYEKCICDCGNEKWVMRKSLLNGDNKSCGCFQKECAARLKATHGMSRSRIYRLYNGAIERCYNKSKNSYINYGARGIRVERLTFEDFYRDMGASYEEHVKQFGERNTTLDRLNSDLNYSKENCKWSTYEEQQNNKRNNHKVVYNGKEYSSIAALGRDLGVTYSSAVRMVKSNKIK